MWQSVPGVVRALVERLRADRFEVALVGGCVRALAHGESPRDWDVTTDAAPELILERFERAIPIGLRHGTVMVPTPAGPVDVTRMHGQSLQEDLARRDFTLNAAALLPGEETPLDPHGGLADLAEGRLRAVGDAAARLAEDPVRALRAARFVATLDVEADPELRAALPHGARALASVAPERLRSEIERMLLGRRASAGLALLRETGIESQLVPGARPDSAAVIAELPIDLPVRLAAWLRDTNAARLLAGWRVSHARSDAVRRLLARHPVDAGTVAEGPSVRRLLRGVGEEGVARLIALRRAECRVGSAAAEVETRLDAIAGALEAAHSEGRIALGRSDLALDGAAVMHAIDCEAGPTVGRALRHLTECVLDDPACNTSERLLERLERWAADQGLVSTPPARDG